MYRQGRFRTWKKPEICQCAHPPLAHYAGPQGTSRFGCRLCPCVKYDAAPQINKYFAKKQEYGGIRYDSKFEAKVAADIDYQLRSGEIQSVRRQVDFPFIINGKRVGRFAFRADFVIKHNDGTQEIREAKGLRMPLFNLKWALMQALYPDLKFTLITERGYRR